MQIYSCFCNDMINYYNFPLTDSTCQSSANKVGLPPSLLKFYLDGRKKGEKWNSHWHTSDNPSLNQEREHWQENLRCVWGRSVKRMERSKGNGKEKKAPVIKGRKKLKIVNQMQMSRTCFGAYGNSRGGEE